jgi:hypothetical protein
MCHFLDYIAVNKQDNRGWLRGLSRQLLEKRLAAKSWAFQIVLDVCTAAKHTQAGGGRKIRLRVRDSYVRGRSFFGIDHDKKKFYGDKKGGLTVRYGQHHYDIEDACTAVMELFKQEILPFIPSEEIK